MAVKQRASCAQMTTTKQPVSMALSCRSAEEAEEWVADLNAANVIV